MKPATAALPPDVRQLRETKEMQQEETTQKKQGEDWRMYVPIVLFSLGNSILRDSGVSAPLAVVIVGSVVYLPAYWFLRSSSKVQISFWKYALLIEYLAVGLALAIWTLPAHLIGKTPVWIGYGLPIFVFLLLLYLLDKFIYESSRKIGIVKWLAGSLAISVLVALLRTFLSSRV